MLTVGRLLRPILLTALFGAGAFLHLWLAFTDTSTEDEHVHMYSGMVLLENGRSTVNLEHPPLAKLIGAASLSLARPSPPQRVELWDANLLGYAVADFAYRNAVPLQKMLIWSRLPFVLLTLGLAGMICVAAWRLGYVAAMVATTLTLLAPLLLAVGHLVHSDLPVTFFVTAAWLLGMRLLERGSNRAAIFTGALFGLALLTKYSALIFLAAFLVIALLTKGRRRHVVTVVVTTLAVVWLGMQLAHRAADADYLEPLAKVAGASRPLLENVVLRPLGIYAAGFQTFLLRGELAVNYFAGDFSTDGWWYYFPVAFTLKTPLGVLLLIAAAVATRIRHLDRGEVMLLAPVILYFTVSFFSTYNIGVRHLLPIYPFLYLFAARSLAAARAPKRLRWAAAGLAAFASLEALVVYPHEMGFFNYLAGPRETATFILSDSNVDWGQDNGRLRRLLEKRRWLPQVMLMGGSIPELEIGPGLTRIDPFSEPARGVYAISRTLFVELTQFAALPPTHPVRRRLADQPRYAAPYGVFLLRMAERGRLVATVGNSVDVWEVP
jgi:hypothetical protein